jgi:hypothetical protein
MHTISQAQDPNDPGLPDTIWVDCGTKAVHDTGGWVAYTVYLKTDNQGAGKDIWALDLPLYITSSSPNDFARFDTTVGLIFANSAFNDSGTYLAVDVDSLGLDGRFGLGAVQFSGSGLTNGTYTLAQLWIHLSDSSHITIDTTTPWGSHIFNLVTSQAVGYVPIWKKAACSVCVHSSPPGDAACNGGVTLSDVIYLVNHLFKGWPPPCCPVLGDINCSGKISLADVIFLVNYIFKGGSAPQYCP